MPYVAYSIFLKWDISLLHVSLMFLYLFILVENVYNLISIFVADFFLGLSYSDSFLCGVFFCFILLWTGTPLGWELAQSMLFYLCVRSFVGLFGMLIVAPTSRWFVGTGSAAVSKTNSLESRDVCLSFAVLRVPQSKSPTEVVNCMRTNVTFINTWKK